MRDRAIGSIVALSLTSALWGQPNFVNWENPHVHPIDMTPDGSLLLAVNTPDNRLEVFDLASGTPVHLASIPVGLDPVTVRARNDAEAWVVNHISDTISIVDLITGNVVATISTDDEPADIVFAGSPELAFVTCSQADSLLVLDPSNPAAPVISFAQAPQDQSPLPTQLGATVRLNLAGNDPRAMAVRRDGGEVYVAFFESGNRTTILGGGDLSGGTTFAPNVVDDPLSPYFDPTRPFQLGINPPNPPPNDGTSFFPPIHPLLPPPPRVGLIVRQEPDDRWLDDNEHDWTHLVSGPDADHSGRPVGWSLLDHDVAVIDPATLSVRYVGDLANIGMALAVNPDSGRVTLVGTDATNEVRFEPVVNGRFLRVNLSTFDPAGPANAAITDLNAHLVYSDTIPFVPIPEEERSLSVGDPRGVVWNASGTRGYVTGMGSNNVVVINADGSRAVSRPIPVGEGPTGLVLDETRQRLYVLNKFAAAVSVIDTASELEILPRHSLFDPTPPSIKIGRKHLYDTHRNSGLGHISCASCHVDARTDRLDWDLGDPGGQVKPFNQNCNGLPGATCDGWHPMKGPMLTQTLQNIIGNEPHHWRGDRDGLEEFAGAFASLLGDDAPLPAPDMQEFEDFLASIHFPPNPYRNIDNSLPDDLPLTGHFATGRFAATGGLPAGTPLPNGNAQSGLVIYRAPGMDGGLACVSCHTLPSGLGVDGVVVGGQFQPLPLGPNGEHHLMISAADGSTNRSMKVPQLRNLFERTGFELTQSVNLSGFGFLHDGSVDSIARFISAPVFSINSDQEVADLVAFMLSFSGSDLPLGDPGNPLEFPGPPSLDTHAAVGWQMTLDGDEAAEQLAVIADRLALADAGAVGVVVKGRQGGLHRGYAYLGSGNFQSDRDDEQIDSATLLTAAAIGSELTVTVVPFGTQHRIGIDRDLDGHFDRDELDGCADPADPDSVPPQCPCGGVLGIPCDAPDQFCKLPIGACCCDAEGKCALMPSACPDIDEPVCGCDGVTYVNSCEADAVGMNIAHLGACNDACMETAPVQPDPAGHEKNRFLSIVVGNSGISAAIRVIARDLPAPYDAYNDTVLWARSPVIVSESAGSPGPPGNVGEGRLTAAPLSCDTADAYFIDWSPIPLLHLYHELIVPGGLYEVSIIASACDMGVESNYSTPMVAKSARWGDAVGHFDMGTQQWTAPDAVVNVPSDVIAILDKFRNAASAPGKPRCDLEPARPDFLINIADVTRCLDAFIGKSYPFPPPPTCP